MTRIVTGPSRRPSRRILWIGAAGMAGLAVAAWVHSPCKLIYNPSESAPLGWYLQLPAGDPKVGQKVLARLPQAIAAFAAARGYLPLEVPILKPVAAVSGQRVCAEGNAIWIGGRLVGIARVLDGAGRPLPHWVGCRAMRPNELFLLSQYHSASFDSRYFGPVDRSAVIGRVIALWTW